MKLSGKKVYVLGGAGFIGSHLVERLLQGGARVTVVDNLVRGSLDKLDSVSGHYSFQNIDLEHTVPDLSDADVVYNLAAKISNIRYNMGHHLDMMQRNLGINWNVAEAIAHAKHLQLYAMVSTVCVYPHDAPVPTTEAAGAVCNPEPTNFGYGIAKWVAEQQAKFLHDECGVPTLIVRFANAFGLRDYYDDESSHVVPALIKRILSGEDPLVIWGTGNQTRSLIDARDIADALFRLGECEDAHNAQAVNIGHDREVSIKEMARLIMQIVDVYPEMQFDLTQPDGHSRRAFDTTRLKSLIHWEPEIPFAQTVREMIVEYQSMLEVA